MTSSLVGSEMCIRDSEIQELLSMPKQDVQHRSPLKHRKCLQVRRDVQKRCDEADRQVLAQQRTRVKGLMA
eukprot:11091547-Prorocentrum_lima.AAC.1